MPERMSSAVWRTQDLNVEMFRKALGKTLYWTQIRMQSLRRFNIYGRCYIALHYPERRVRSGQATGGVQGRTGLSQVFAVSPGQFPLPRRDVQRVQQTAFAARHLAQSSG